MNLSSVWMLNKFELMRTSINLLSSVYDDDDDDDEFEERVDVANVILPRS